MAERIRSFIAFDIEDPKVLMEVKRVQDMLIQTGADLKLVKPSNIHITIRFLGNISPSMVDPIYEKMRQISFRPFDMEIRGLGAFPTPHRARVVWMGIRRGERELREIFNQLEPGLRRLGFQPDPKGFSPHITIARVRTPRNRAELVGCIRRLADHPFGVVRAESLRLKRSVLTPSGPIYSTLREVRAVGGG